jgi:type IV pilus assembly protein PilB
MPVHTQDEVIDALVSKRVVSREAAERAAHMAAADPQHPSTVYHLVRRGDIPAQELSLALARHYGTRTIDVENTDVPAHILGRISPDLARERRVLPIKEGQDGALHIGVLDPQDVTLLDDLEFFVGGRVIPVVIDEFSLDRLIDQHYDQGGPDVQSLLSHFGDADEIEVLKEEEVDAATQEQIDSAPAVRLVDGVLTEAVKRGASDVHFEWFEDDARIRFRIDGSLIVVAGRDDAHRLKNNAAAIVSRLKIISRLDPTERRLPQDGKTRLRVRGTVIDFRVSTMPTAYGENVVLRILDRGSMALDMDTLGITGRNRLLIEKAARSPYGMVLVTGPTGSGKSTTLYTVLQDLNRADNKCLTVEDPIEFTMKGVTQVAVDNKTKRTFATALRAFLRQDPDVIMVGEIRDNETAEIALRAALTGHLVLSTLHTNDAAGTVTRLTEMGMERYNLASALRVIVAQRLVRRLCTACSARVTYTADHLWHAGLTPEQANTMTFHRGAGCTKCNLTGYKGRSGLYEVLPIDGTVGELIIAGGSASEIKAAAVAAGMQTLREAGLELVAAGKTSLEEVIKVTAA